MTETHTETEAETEIETDRQRQRQTGSCYKRKGARGAAVTLSMEGFTAATPSAQSTLAQYP